MSTPGNRTNGNTGVLTKKPDTCEILGQPLLGQRLPDHQPGGDLGERRAGRLREIRHRARRARIHLEHVDHVVLDRELRVHQADDVQRARDAAGVVANRGDVRLAQLERRHDARAVAGVDAGLLDVLHDAADDDGAARVGQRVDVDLGRVFEELVDQDRMFGRRLHGVAHVAIERGRVVDDRHRAAAEHVRRPHDDRESDLGPRPSAPLPATWRCRSPPAGCRAPRAAWRSARGPRPDRSNPATCRGSARRPPAAPAPASAASARRTARRTRRRRRRSSRAR